jgi:hypothetical protein
VTVVEVALKTCGASGACNIALPGYADGVIALNMLFRRLRRANSARWLGIFDFKAGWLLLWCSEDDMSVEEACEASEWRTLRLLVVTSAIFGWCWPQSSSCRQHIA